MTISYTHKVTSCKGVGGCFLGLLLRWKGSIYKLVWSDLILYLFIYYILNLSYYYVLDDKAKLYFEDIVKYANKYGSLIPLSFVLGFFVDLVMERWWNQYTSIPFPDNLAILVGAGIKGQNIKPRAVRRTIVRYACATFTITLTMISPKVKKRFPTLDHFIEAGLLTNDEKNIMQDLNDEYPNYAKYWLPLAWASNIVITSREEGLIRDDECLEKILDEINQFRDRCGRLLDYDWISVPLVYTQVVTIAVYSYFLISVIGNQQLTDEKNAMNSYFPLIPILEFMFYMGWLKVAETLINPFGNDDDDFDVMWMIDRHIQVVYLLVDKIPFKMPKLTKDIHWNETEPIILPFTKASENFLGGCPLASTNYLTLSKADQEMFIPRRVTKPDTSKNRTDNILHTEERNTLKNSVIVLKSVITENDVNFLDEVDEAAVNDDEEKETEYCEAFENLRKQRMKEKQNKVNTFLKEINAK